jgi:hypothetical protein
MVPTRLKLAFASSFFLLFWISLLKSGRKKKNDVQSNCLMGFVPYSLIRLPQLTGKGHNQKKTAKLSPLLILSAVEGGGDCG